MKNSKRCSAVVVAFMIVVIVRGACGNRFETVDVRVQRQHQQKRRTRRNRSWLTKTAASQTVFLDPEGSTTVNNLQGSAEDSHGQGHLGRVQNDCRGGGSYLGGYGFLSSRRLLRADAQDTGATAFVSPSKTFNPGLPATLQFPHVTTRSRRNISAFTVSSLEVKSCCARPAQAGRLGRYVHALPTAAIGHKFRHRLHAATTVTDLRGTGDSCSSAEDQRDAAHEETTVRGDQGDESACPEVPNWRYKAVIIPGFGTDARAFEKLCKRLDRRGVASVVVPIRWYHWLPTLGGRSVRPILDRIHETVLRCVAAKAHSDLPYAFNEPGLQNEVAPYTVQDFFAEMGDPKRGAHHMGPLNIPRVPTKPAEEDRVILIAHSAGGWMSRIYLSNACYDGRVYDASSLVNGLVTLGTPHVRLQDDHGRDRNLPFSRNFKFVNERCTGDKGGRWEQRVPTACVGGAVLRGRSSWGGLLKDLPYTSYELCCGDGSGDGDGITPLQSAFDMEGAKRFLELKGVYHSVEFGGPWYGSESVIDSWLKPALDLFFGSRAGGATATAKTLAADKDDSEAMVGLSR